MANVYVRSAAAGAGTGADWANAYTTLGAALTAKAAGDSFWVAADHAETAAAAVTLTSPGTAANPCFIYCVNQAGAVPPVSPDLRTTASIATTLSNSLTLAGGYAYVYGVTFKGGSGATSGGLSLGSAASWWMLDTCALQRLATNAGSITIGANSSSINVRIDLKNTTMQFGSTSDVIKHQAAKFTWTNTPNAVTGAILPAVLFGANSFSVGDALIEGVDLSALGSGTTLVGAIPVPKVYTLKDCKIGANVVVASVPASQSHAETYVVRSDSANSYRHEKYQYMGTQVVETTIVRTGGTSDGATALSWNLTTTANSRWALPFEAFPIAIWNTVTGSNVGVTVEGVWSAAALPNNDDVWIDVEYLGSAGSPQGSFKYGSKADNLATGVALTASAQAWDSQVTARANSTAYTLGAVRKVASNPGRIFFCTTAGTSASSEPAGFASAVDGGSVTDGTAVFRAAVRFKQTVTLSSPQPAQASTLYVYPKVAKASTTVYLDPLITLS